MNLSNIIEEVKEKGIDLLLKYIPREVFDKRAIEKNQVVFYDMSYIEVKPHYKNDYIAIELTDFSVHYNLDNTKNIEESLKSGSNRIAVENGKIFKISKSKEGIITKDLLTKNWFDWIDYWSIDFNYEKRKEILKINNYTTSKRTILKLVELGILKEDSQKNKRYIAEEINRIILEI